MSFLKKPFRKLKELGNNSANSTAPPTTELTKNGVVPSKTEGISSTTGSGTDTPPNGEKTNGEKTNGATGKLNGDSKRQSREAIQAERARRSMDKERVKTETKKRETMARIEDERFLKEGPPMLTKLYRPYSMNQSKRWTHEDRLLFKNINWEGKYFLGFEVWR